MARLLITRPEHDATTRYLSRWSEQIIKEAKKKGMDVIDLYREKVNRARFIGTLEKSAAALFLEPSNYLAITLLKGHSTGDANRRSKAFFRKNIERLLVSGPLSEDYDAIKLLYWDMTHQVCLSNKDATL